MPLVEGLDMATMASTKTNSNTATALTKGDLGTMAGATTSPCSGEGSPRILPRPGKKDPTLVMGHNLAMAIILTQFDAFMKGFLAELVAVRIKLLRWLENHHRSGLLYCKVRKNLVSP